jgi:hypothetical protein
MVTDMKVKEETRRITVSLPVSLHKLVSEHALALGHSMNVEIILDLTNYLLHQPSPAERRKRLDDMEWLVVEK